MVSVTPHSVASVTFAAYFLHRLLTVNPFLPKVTTFHSQISPLKLILLFTVYVPLCFLADLSTLSIFFFISWCFATFAALRFAYDPSLPQNVDVPKWLNASCLLLWRVDIVIYFVFSVWSLAASHYPSLISLALALLLTFTAISIFVFGVLLRVHAQSLPITLRNSMYSLFHTSPHSQSAMTVPPTVYDASAFELLSFKWAFPIVQTGFRRSLEFSDVPSLAEQYSARNLLNNRFLPAWNLQLRRPNPSVLKALYHAFGLRLVLGGVLKLVNDLGIFVAPLLLRAVREQIKIYETNLHFRCS